MTLELKDLKDIFNNIKLNTGIIDENKPISLVIFRDGSGYVSRRESGSSIDAVFSFHSSEELEEHLVKHKNKKFKFSVILEGGTKEDARQKLAKMLDKAEIGEYP